MIVQEREKEVRVRVRERDLCVLRRASLTKSLCKSSKHKRIFHCGYGRETEKKVRKWIKNVCDSMCVYVCVYERERERDRWVGGRESILTTTIDFLDKTKFLSKNLFSEINELATYTHSNPPIQTPSNPHTLKLSYSGTTLTHPLSPTHIRPLKNVITTLMQR